MDILEHNEDVYMHTHDCIELVIILSGHAEHVIDDESYDLNPGDVFVVSRNSKHGYKNVCNLKLSNIMFDYQNLADNLSELRQLPGFQTLFVLEPQFRKEHRFERKLQLDPMSISFVKLYLDILLKEYEGHIIGHESAISIYFLALITYLSRQFYALQSKGTSKLFRLANAISYMENNFLKLIAIDEVAAISYLSTRQFTRIFMKSYKMSPKAYIIKLRLNHACQLMENKHMNLSEIALQSGFSDISFFSRQFKTKLGLTPKAYRKSFEENK